MMRPLRSLVESTTEKVPRGPLGFIGRGNALGAVNYFSVSLINGIIPINGLDVGFNIESSSVERFNNTSIHTFVINSYNRDVARFVAKYRSAPSNVDFFSQKTEIISVKPIKERRTVTTWEVVVEVKERELDG